MQLMRSEMKTYARFLFPGSFVSEESVKEVPSRNVAELDIPGNAFALQFFDQGTAVFNVDGHEVEFTSKRINVSGNTYIGGLLMTLEEVRQRHPDKSNLIANMEGNGWNRVIQCRTGNFQPFEDGDTQIAA